MRNMNDMKPHRDVFGQKQSPVDITTSCTEYDEDLRLNPIAFQYREEDNMEITNTGHTAKALIGQVSTISEGPLRHTYQLKQFHLHWGSTESQGSEHTLEGSSYAGEIHLVHWNRDIYSGIQEAKDKPGGLAVLGVFLQVGQEHQGFRCITDCLSDVVVPSEKSHVMGRFNPKCLFPENTSDYWTYSGSLTTPPHCETVTWVVFRDPVEVSLSQMKALRSLRCGDHGGEYIVDNFRHTCPINDRRISASFQV